MDDPDIVSLLPSPIHRPDGILVGIARFKGRGRLKEDIGKKKRANIQPKMPMMLQKVPQPMMEKMSVRNFRRVVAPARVCGRGGAVAGAAIVRHASFAISFVLQRVCLTVFPSRRLRVGQVFALFGQDVPSLAVQESDEFVALA